ncbi:PAS domain S-box protein [Archangium sp.]|uniref:PAS domain S-box protein n=1 Tax=Archangium sp. TaxID=1872627 RepID=UPI002D443531|nr:PAS domain S-box protein [Archangium sp.]HYO59349.1 PAS domain S-box protein [Archangium sp.]
MTVETQAAVEAGGRVPTLVVGLGGSAGALDAYEAFFQNLPASTPAAFVLVQHLDASHQSLLPDLLTRMTSMPVRIARHGTVLEPGHLYVAEPATNLRLDGNTLKTTHPQSPEDRFHPIDRFFESLAQLRDRAIGIVLSGTGSDGVTGLQSITRAGGMVLAQDPATARFDGMPRSALASGAVHHVTSPGEMPALVLARLRLLSSDVAGQPSHDALQQALPRICELILERTGHDFYSYKKTTLLRRLEKRMQARHCASVDEYVRVLGDEPTEAFEVQKEMLIGVTRFFRDTAAFETLSQQIIPLLCRKRPEGAPIRIWVPACSTGEEAYSLAILFREFADRHGTCPPVNLFATDIDAAAVDSARQGVYPSSIEQQLSKERLARFFVHSSGEYRVSQELRDTCTFAVHDLLKAPPFSRMDLISCRNLFIYFESELQARLIPVLHYALAPEGFLMLGPAEGISGSSELFRVMDKKHRIYQRREGVTRPALSFASLPSGRTETRSDRVLQRVSPDRDLTRAIAAELFDNYAPPALVIDEHGEILFFVGKTARFLECPTGAPTNNAFELIARSIRPEAHALVHRAISTRKEAVHPNLALESSAGLVLRVDLVVRPLPALVNDTQAYLLVFREVAPARSPEQAEREGVSIHSPDSVVHQLEAELRDTRAYLQSTIEEVKSSNEELLSMNEELQSANEELQTSKEEFQSLNEELETVNSELSKKVEELDRAHSDLQNFFENTRIPSLFLDTELRIKKFTPATEQLFRLIPSDVGRPFTDIASSLPTADLPSQFREVIRTLRSLERELSTVDGSKRHYLMRVNPYRTVSNVISGVVITFSDVTDLKKTQEREATLAAIVESSADAIISRTLDGIVTSWNLGAEALFWYSAREMLGKPVAVLFPEELRERYRALEDDVRQGRVVTGFETECLRKDGQRISVSLTLSPILDRAGQLSGFSVILRDIGEKRRAAIERARLAAIIESSDDAIIGKDLNGVITSWNPAAERLFGYSAQEMVGTTIHRLVPPDHPEDVARILNAIRRGERVKHYETVRVCKNGRRVHVSLSVSPVKDETGRIIGASKIARDISERIAADEALKRGLELREEFISLASHELKTPLTSMKLQTDMMKRGFAKDDPKAFSRERVLKLVEQTDRQLERLQHLVEDMLDISRMGAKGLTLRREQVNLSQLTHDTLGLLSSYVASSGCTLTEDIHPDVIGFWDKTRLEQVITNLLTNACRYAPGKPITVRVKSDGEWAMLAVEDRGMGIAPKDHDRIFERFEQVSSKSVGGGFGIGLYIVKEVVSGHGGTVRVHSAPGEGATFVVALPLGGPRG